MQKLKKHIAIIFTVLLGIIIPKETWHLFTDHTDTSCEFNTGCNVEAEHTHCSMLEFETSSYDYQCNIESLTESKFHFNYINQETVFSKLFLEEYINLRGPPLV